MAKRRDEDPDILSEDREESGEAPEKRGFFSRLFQPLPDDEEAPPEEDGEALWPEPPVKKKKKKKKPERRPAKKADEPFELDLPEQEEQPEAAEWEDESPQEDVDGDAPIEEEPEAASPLDEPPAEEPGQSEPPADVTARRRKPRRMDEQPPVQAPEAEPVEAPDDFVGYPTEEIRLFDDEDEAVEDRPRGDTTRTRLIRTGSQTTTRIHLNETEETIRAERARRRAEERAEREKREAAAERRGKRKKRQATLQKLFSNVAFVLFFIVAVAVALYYGFLLSDVVVLGNDSYTADYIVELSGLKKGTHMLLCNLDEAEANISENPYLQVDSINYIFPSRIRIVITERKEAAGIIGLDYNVIIDKNGYVLSMSGGTDISKLLQVTGVSMTGFQLGQRLGEGNDFTTATLIQIIEKLEEYELMDSIASIDLTTPLAIAMTAKNGLHIHLGQSTDLDAKMQSLKKLLPQFFNQSISTGTLYLSAKGGTVYSPAGAEGDAMANQAAAAAGTVAPEETLPDYVDNDNDGYDDETGEPIVTPNPEAPTTTPTPPPTPTPRVPGGASDEFSG